VHRCKSALAALSLTLSMVAPTGAEQVPASLPREVCAGCLAYLEFPPPDAEASAGECDRHQGALPTVPQDRPTAKQAFVASSKQ
jgi:hypothetical protein